MPNESGRFGIQLFAGFNRRDVLAYIGGLAKKRNACMRQIEELSSDNENLRGLIAQAENKLREAERNILNMNANTLSSAENMISNLQSEYESVRSDVSVTTSHVRGELLRICDTLSLMNSILEKTDVQFSNLREFVANEKSEIIENLNELTSDREV
jgi:Tfp pilus assembly protein PilX